MVINLLLTGMILQVPSLKLTANAPENGWLEDEIPFGFRPIFRCHVTFLGCIY